MESQQRQQHLIDHDYWQYRLTLAALVSNKDGGSSWDSKVVIYDNCCSLLVLKFVFCTL